MTVRVFLGHRSVKDVRMESGGAFHCGVRNELGEDEDFGVSVGGMMAFPLVGQVRGDFGTGRWSISSDHG